MNVNLYVDKGRCEGQCISCHTAGHRAISEIFLKMTKSQVSGRMFVSWIGFNKLQLPYDTLETWSVQFDQLLSPLRAFSSVLNTVFSMEWHIIIYLL